VADRPLRPATDRRLGRPLPHQLPNRTQAAPKAHHCFGPQPICGISPSFPGLSPTSGYVPTRYSPVRHSHCWACDLHVLSMPPAFALSQDQTLRFIHHHQAQTPSSSSEPPCSHSLTKHSQPSHRTTRHQAISPKASKTSQPQTPGRRPRIPPLTTRQPSRHPATTQQAPQPHTAQHPAIPNIKEQPRTKHFQNRCNYQRTTPKQPETTSGEATSQTIPTKHRSNQRGKEPTG
jgi:hypothetical protein